MLKQLETSAAHKGYLKHVGTLRVSGSFSTHFDIEVICLLKGSLTYIVGRSEVAMNIPGRIHTFWGATPHRFSEAERDTEIAIFRIPLASFALWESSKHHISSLVDGSILNDGGRTATTEKILQWSDELESTNSNLVNASIMEIQAMVWRSNILSTTKKTSAATSSDIDAVIAMSKFIFGNLEAVLNSQQVAKAVGLHPNYAMRIFKKIAGMTIQEYVVAHRVSTAQRLLLTDSEPIEIVGKRSGFQSTSQYYAVFKQQTGLSPLQYRKKYAA